MKPESAREHADAAFADRAWAVAASAYAEADADADQPMPPAELERWGLAAFLVGRSEESDTARERAHHAYLVAGDIEAAARVGHWLGMTLVLRGEPARGGGWFARAQTVLDENGVTDSVWHQFLLLSAGMRTLFDGDAERAREIFTGLVREAERYDDPDLTVLVRNGLGQALVATGRVTEGLRQLDEVMVTVTTHVSVSPQIVGLVYCAVIDTCRRCFDLDRAREWTEVLNRWCAQQPELVPYRGQCLVHRAELMQHHGSWPDASAEVDRVFAQLGDVPTDAAAGMAYYQRGELYRLRGESDTAEAAFRKASRSGHDPQPGLALLRLAQGQISTARAMIRRAVDEDRWTHDRVRLLPAYVEIALSAADVAAAVTAADELRDAAEHRDAPALTATAAHAQGTVALEAGDPSRALRLLREALSIWQAMAMPYDAARTRVQIAAACRALGDGDSAELELDAARWVFEQLGAGPDLALLPRPRGPSKPREAPGGLTAREAQILRIVATGATNKAIAAELFLSEKTVARHVANIFVKLDVKSRAGATAFAFTHHLV